MFEYLTESYSLIPALLGISFIQLYRIKEDYEEHKSVKKLRNGILGWLIGLFIAILIISMF
ncbi:hypothetical protein HNP92_000888 [Methanococcus maripaludis]|uniref:Uncharacterized protein n=1 Tax=Methanococcus maripaludis TaxID=39152 RepID=A0A7J9PS00_METMI|nr:hypothetical protein [Methanococcus maripaludis]MBA2868926.1 hypothetical protein [Methanococcus maripaludis]MBB6401583.1 hypothetical protein [Methanococcus maripaludis]